jgi:hypothetical protein
VVKTWLKIGCGVVVCFPAVLLAVFGARPLTAAQAGSIDSIAPAAARPGERVTVRGIGFGGRNVVVTVGGIIAQVVAARGAEVTFLVPPGLVPGATLVTATNPGGRTGSITFQIPEGVLLAGGPSALAIDSTFDLPPVGVDQSQIEAGVIMTRLDVRLSPIATVGQVNDVLAAVGGGVVSMSRGFVAVTISVPRQPTIQALQAIVDQLAAAPGVRFAKLAVVSSPDVLPTPHRITVDHHLLPTRFPAAWNVKSLVMDPAGNCRQPRVPVLVGDKFVRPAPQVPDVDSSGNFSFLNFSDEIPNFQPSPPDASEDDTHGYDVTLTLGGLFNAQGRTGANPFSPCLDFTGVILGALSGFEEIDRLVQNFPPGKFILNLSRSFGKVCADLIDGQGAIVPCEPRHFGSVIPNAIQRAQDALHWKERTFARWPDFLTATSAGNIRDDEPAAIYPALGTAVFNSFMNTATVPDPFLGFAADPVLWRPTLTGFPSLAATSAEAFRLTNEVQALGLDQVGGADNTLMVGSTTKGSTIVGLVESEFSNSGSDVKVVGEDVLNIELRAVKGTSFAAPQVAGLASYLWLLSNDLRNTRPTSVTRRAIVDNTRSVPGVGGVIDAYAAVLSLDRAVSPTTVSAPIRLAILDLTGDNVFDEVDLKEFVSKYATPAQSDYSRWDLNGDGNTGGNTTERFDLDRVGSTQYGQTLYDARVTQAIEGETVSFDETDLTDLRILCYYAYSDLYTGNPFTRRNLFNGRCSTSGVTVLTGQVTLHYHADFPQVHPSLFEDTKISASVTVEIVRLEVDGNDVDVEGIVRQASGIGTRTEGADLTGCGRLPEVDTGKVIGGGISFAFPEVQLGLVVSGTSTSTTCSSTTQSTFLGNLKDGTLRGTAIISNGSITAIDFNRTTNNGNRVTITTGRLSP